MLCCLIATQQTFAARYLIHGIKGSMANNVDLRLSLLEKNSPTLSNTQLIENIKLAMAPFGYYSPKIKVNNKDFQITAGIATHIKSINIRIEGPGKELLEPLLKTGPLQEGNVFKSEDFDNAKQQLFDKAEQNGYLNARMRQSQALINPLNGQAHISLHFETGDLYHFGAINFNQTSAYNPLFLERYLSFKPGEAFSTEKLLTFNASLNDSGYFQKISIKPRISKKTIVPIDVFLHDKPSQNYLAGLGYITDTGARARIGWQWLRVNDFGHTFQALYIGSQKQNTLQAQYVIPGFKPSTDQYTFSSKVFQLNYPLGRSHAQQYTAASLFEKKGRQYTISINALNESFNFNGFSKITKKVLYPNIKVAYKQINSPIFSKHGFALNSNAKTARTILGSDLNLAQIELSAKIAVWLPSHTRLFFRGNAGFTNTDDINAVPLSLQLLAGGADSIRGYHYQSLGPGKRLIVGSAEIQQETFFDDWFVNAFYDIGDVYQPLANHWKRGVGAGIMWVSPMGPIRLSLAKALDDEGKPLRVIFNMGPDL